MTLLGGMGTVLGPCGRVHRENVYNLIGECVSCSPIKTGVEWFTTIAIR